MNTRYFSILRRKPSLMDFNIPQRPYSDGVGGFQFNTDTDPGGSFSTIAFKSPIWGFVDPSVAGPQHVITGGNAARIIIDPSVHGLDDNYALWLKMFFLDYSGAVMSTVGPSAATLVLPPIAGGFEQSGFTGTAPLGAVSPSLATSLRIDLPRSMENFRLRNLDPTNNLIVAFQEGGPEITVPVGTEDIEVLGLVSSFWVRGDVASVKFTAQFVAASPR